MRDLMFAVVWAVALPISIISPYSGILLWIWVALLSPNELLYGFMAGVPFNKLVAVTTLSLMFVSKEKKDFYLDGILILLLLLALHATGSYLTQLVPSDDGTDLYLKLIKEIVLAFAIVLVMTTRHRLHLTMLAFVIALSFLGVKEGLISLLTAGGHQIIGSGAIGDNNSLATALLMIAPFTIYLARYSAVPVMRTGLMAAAGLSVVTAVMTFSRGGFIGLLVLSLMLLKNSGNKLRSVMLIVPAAVMIYVFAPEAWFARLNTIESAGSDSSFMGRVVAWKISTLIAMDHPLFGGGPHAVQRVPVWSYYLPRLPSLDFISTPPPDVFPHAAHSIYFEVLGDLGFGGIALFLALLALAYWRCRTVIRMTRFRPDLAWAADIARMAQISMAVYIVTAAALSMAYFELLYIVVALISRTHRTVTQALLVPFDAAAAVPSVARRGRFVLGPLAQPPVAAAPLAVPSRGSMAANPRTGMPLQR